MTELAEPQIRPKERDAIIQALAAGVVPRLGLKYIQVGRLREVQALVKDIDRIADNGSCVRFIIGEYGAGKTFFLNLIRLIAMEKRLVTVSADLAPNRRLQATGGQAQSLYAETLRNLSTRNKPDGAGLASVVSGLSGMQLPTLAHGAHRLKNRSKRGWLRCATLLAATILPKCWQPTGAPVRMAIKRERTRRCAGCAASMQPRRMRGRRWEFVRLLATRQFTITGSCWPGSSGWRAMQAF